MSFAEPMQDTYASLEAATGQDLSQGMAEPPKFTENPNDQLVTRDEDGLPPAKRLVVAGPGAAPPAEPPRLSDGLQQQYDEAVRGDEAEEKPVVMYGGHPSPEKEKQQLAELGATFLGMTERPATDVLPPGNPRHSPRRPGSIRIRKPVSWQRTTPRDRSRPQLEQRPPPPIGEGKKIGCTFIAFAYGSNGPSSLPLERDWTANARSFARSVATAYSVHDTFEQPCPDPLPELRSPLLTARMLVHISDWKKASGLLAPEQVILYGGDAGGLRPVQVDGDNHNVFRALSYALFGSRCAHLALRFLSACRAGKDAYGKIMAPSYMGTEQDLDRVSAALSLCVICVHEKSNTKLSSSGCAAVAVLKHHKKSFYPMLPADVVDEGTDKC